MRRSKRNRPPSGAATCTTDGAGKTRRRGVASAATGRMIFSGDFRCRFTALAGYAEMVPLLPLQGLFDLRRISVLRIRAKRIPLLRRCGRRASDGSKRSALRRRRREDAGPLSGCGAAVRSDDPRPHDSRRSRRAAVGCIGAAPNGRRCGGWGFPGAFRRSGESAMFIGFGRQKAGRILRCRSRGEDGPPPEAGAVVRRAAGIGRRAQKQKKHSVWPGESS